MKVWTRIDSPPQTFKHPLVLALGNFDGVHLGHQAVLKQVVKRAKERGGVPSVLTFSEHPQRVLHPASAPRLLASPQHRLFIFREVGIEVCFLLSFSLEFSKTPPEDFVRQWLVGRLRVAEVHLGYNAHFGQGRGGDASQMQRLAVRYGFDFFEAPPVKVGGEFVSSSLIRQLIQKGELSQAKKLLGRPFTIFATVVRGKGRGRSLGYPTANLRPHSEILPPRGVYPVELRVNLFHLRPASERGVFDYVAETPGPWRQGILNFGVRPTFESTAIEVPEVFLFDFEGELYGKTVEVKFHPRLREEKEFQNPEALQATIARDVNVARHYFTRL